jgi:hypothetical protein
MGPAGQPGTLLTTCHANESGLAIGHHASSRTDPDDAECDAGVYGLTVRAMQPREPGYARRVPGRCWPGRSRWPSGRHAVHDGCGLAGRREAGTAAWLACLARAAAWRRDTSDELGLAVARLVAGLLVPAGEPVVVAIDDTLFRRRGKKVWAASWFHDGSAPGPAKTGYGNNWVIAAIVVKLPAVRRPVAIPVLAKLVIKNTSSASRLWLGRRMTEMLAGALPGRDIHVVADSAYAGGELKKLPPQVTWTTRLRKDAALHGLPPQRTGKRGRPRQKGDRLPALAGLAATAAFTEVTVTRYGKTAAISAAAVTCLWPTVFGTRAVPSC